MDDDKDKGIIEKTIEAVEEFASEVKDTAKHMMDPPEPLKPGDEVVMMPSLDDGMFGPPTTPQFMVIHHPRKSSAKKAPKKRLLKRWLRKPPRSQSKKQLRKCRRKSLLRNRKPKRKRPLRR